jgi:hypothetical protein
MKISPIKWIEGILIYRCGHRIKIKVPEVSFADPCGLLYKMAKRSLPISESKICPMCSEEKIWKS